MWTPNEGLMDGINHEIIYFNSISQSVERFLSGLQNDIPYDDSISSNPKSFLWEDKICLKKLKQNLKLSQYYLRFKKTLCETSQPKTNLQKAVYNHFFTANEPVRESATYEPYVMPGALHEKKEIIIGVCTQFFTRNAFRLSVIICSHIDNTTAKIEISFPNLDDVTEEIIKNAVNDRSIIMVNYIKQNDEHSFDFDERKRNSFIIFNVDASKYSFLSVSSIY